MFPAGITIATPLKINATAITLLRRASANSFRKQLQARTDLHHYNTDHLFSHTNCGKSLAHYQYKPICHHCIHGWGSTPHLYDHIKRSFLLKKIESKL
jgi:hypothetical protein